MEKDNNKDINSLGEFGLIRHLSSNLHIKNPSTVKGIGDDAAVSEKNEREYLLTSTEIFLEGIHFNLMYTPLKHLGYKVIVAGISDIYAMNGNACQVMINLAVSGKFTLKAIDELYQGIRLACDKYQIDLTGGDTSTSLTGLSLGVTSIGAVDKNRIAYRSAAGNNDLICVSGDLGAAYMGLQLLEREKKIFESNPDEQPQLEGYDYILERQLKPEARKDLLDMINQTEIKISSMIDVSDGLSSDLLHLCVQSNLGCLIYQEKIPIHPNTLKFAGEINFEPVIAALNGGDDYELLFTVPVEQYEVVAKIPDVSVIGYMTNSAEGCYLVSQGGEKIAIKAQGWS